MDNRKLSKEEIKGAFHHSEMEFYAKLDSDLDEYIMKLIGFLREKDEQKAEEFENKYIEISFKDYVKPAKRD